MIFRKQYLNLLVITLIISAIFLTMPTQESAKADVGVQPILPGGSSIKPTEDTPIEMVSEKVTINVREATEADNALVKLNSKYYGYDFVDIWFKGIAEVGADFIMRNPTDKAITQNVWFPLASALDKAYWSGDRPGEIVPRLENFNVNVDSVPLEVTVSDLPNPKGSDQPPLPWASFPVTFPEDKDILIHVSYSVPLQPSLKSYELALYYIFQTGAGWAGSIGKAELILNLPYPASVETMAGMRQNLSLPPMYLPKPAGLPDGVVFNGNQARWTWFNFEPSPEDDFAIWLLQPQKWQQIEEARSAVKVDPNNGQAWLNLAYVYHSLSLSWTNTRLLFSSAYLQPCIDAYQKAEKLMPEHPVPHAALGLFRLEPYLAEQNAPKEVLDFVQKELQTAKELEEKNPSLTEGALTNSEELANALYDYFYNDATATVEAATWEAQDLTQTAIATYNYATRTVLAFAKSTSLSNYATSMNCWATSGSECTATPTPGVTKIPKSTITATITPSPTEAPLIRTAVRSEQSQILLALALIAGLLISGFMITRFTKLH